IHALTVDHGLRAESAQEAKAVAAWVKDWPRIRHSVLNISALRGQSRRMEQAREKRYEVMARYCADKKIGHLFLAHHLDDQAETFLFRLAKGSGLDGLAAMKPRQRYDDNLVLLRPLLDTPKAALIKIC